MTTIAVPDTKPPIVCPSWCTISYEQHLADLDDLEGFVIHWSDLSQPIRHSRGAYVDNTVDPIDPPQLQVDARLADGMSLVEAEAIAQAILAAVAEARS